MNRRIWSHFGTTVEPRDVFGTFWGRTDFTLYLTSSEVSHSQISGFMINLHDAACHSTRNPQMVLKWPKWTKMNFSANMLRSSWMRSGSLGIGPWRISAKFGGHLTSRTAGRDGSISVPRKITDESPSVEPPWDGLLRASMWCNTIENGCNSLVWPTQIGFAQIHRSKWCTAPEMTEMNKNELFRKHASIELNEVGIAWYWSLEDLCKVWWTSDQ